MKCFKFYDYDNISESTFTQLINNFRNLQKFRNLTQRSMGVKLER